MASQERSAQRVVIGAPRKHLRLTADQVERRGPHVGHVLVSERREDVDIEPDSLPPLRRCHGGHRAVGIEPARLRLIVGWPWRPPPPLQVRGLEVSGGRMLVPATLQEGRDRFEPHTSGQQPRRTERTHSRAPATTSPSVTTTFLDQVCPR